MLFDLGTLVRSMKSEVDQRSADANDGATWKAALKDMLQAHLKQAAQELKEDAKPPKGLARRGSTRSFGVRGAGSDDSDKSEDGDSGSDRPKRKRRRKQRSASSGNEVWGWGGTWQILSEFWKCSLSSSLPAHPCRLILHRDLQPRLLPTSVRRDQLATGA